VVEKPHRRNVFALGTSQLITWCVALAWTFVVPRHLGAAGWGMLVTGSSVGGLLVVLMGSGTGNYLVRQFVREPEQAPRLLGTSLISRLVLLLPGAAVLAVYVKVAAFSPQASLVIVIGAAVAVSALLQEPLDSVFQAVERMEYLAAGDVADKVLPWRSASYCSASASRRWRCRPSAWPAWSSPSRRSGRAGSSGRSSARRCPRHGRSPARASPTGP
jgi:hypothetical protein